MKILNVLLIAVTGVLVIDLIGFVLWVSSGQLPVDGFYIGVITKTVLQVIFF